MREAAELAWQRPSGLGVGVRHTCSRHVGLWQAASPMAQEDLSPGVLALA